MDSIKKLESQLQETKEELQHHQAKYTAGFWDNSLRKTFCEVCPNALRSDLDQKPAAYHDLQSRVSLLEVEIENLDVDKNSLANERDRVLTDHTNAQEQIFIL